MPRQIVKSTMTVSSFTLLSRILGFVRDVIFAELLGASIGFDAFIVASKIPNFFRQFFAEGAFSQAFVPVLTAYREKNSAQDVSLLMQRILGLLSVVLLIVTVIGIVAAPLCLRLFAPGLVDDPERFTISVRLLRITFPYLIFISWVMYSGAILNSCDRFAVMAITPLILNAFLIFSAVYGSLWVTPKVEALAWGMLVAGVAQWLFQLPFLKQVGAVFRPKLSWDDPGVRRVLKLMVPGLLGASVAQIGMMVDTWFASYLPIGSISWLYYSDRLTYFPLGVFGFAIAAVILPNLSRHHATANIAKFHGALDWGMRTVLLFGVPAAVGLCLLAGPIVATLFYHGSFTVNDVMMSRLSLMAYVIGLPAFMLIKVLVAGFYAREDMVTPVRVAAVALLLNIVLNIILKGPLAHAGLALATAIAATVNAIVLGILLVKRQVFVPMVGWPAYLVKLVLASLIMACILTWHHVDMQQWLAWPQSGRVARLGVLMGEAVIGYLGSLWLLGVRMSDFNADQA